MKTWDYKVVYMKKYAIIMGKPMDEAGSTEEIEEMLNSLGKEGWELVAVSGASWDTIMVYLKRERT